MNLNVMCIMPTEKMPNIMQYEPMKLNIDAHDKRVHSNKKIIRKLQLPSL